MKIRGGGVAAAAGIAVLAAAGWLLRGEGPAGTAPGGPAAGAGSGAAGAAASAASPRSASAARGAADGGGVREGAGAAESDEAGPVLEIRAVVPGDFPLPEAMILPFGRDADGEPVALFGSDVPEPGSTDVEGIFLLRYPAEPAIRLFGLHGEEGDLLEVKGGKAEGSAGPFLLVRADGEGPVTLTVRDPERAPLLRLLDGATGAVIRDAGPGFLLWDWTDGTDPAEEEPSDDLEEASPGWYEVELPEPGRAARPRVLVAGYRPAPLPAGFTEGRRVLRLERDPGAIRGNLVLPDGPERDWPHSWSLRRADPGDARPIPTVAGTVVRGGPFTLSGLDAGEWVMEVHQVRAAAGRQGTHWAVRPFRYEGAALDLGEIRLEPGAVIRARLFGPDLLPVEGGRLVLLDPRAAERGIPYLRGGNARTPPSIHMAPGNVLHPDEGPEGVAEFRGLRPGSRWILAAPGVPGLLREVEAPAKPGATAEFEIGRGVVPVACRLRFTLGGGEPHTWFQLAAGPANGRDFTTATGILEAPIVAGRHRFVVVVQPEPDGDRVLAAGEVDIPDGVRFEGTVDLEVLRER